MQKQRTFLISKPHIMSSQKVLITIHQGKGIQSSTVACESLFVRAFLQGGSSTAPQTDQAFTRTAQPAWEQAMLLKGRRSLDLMQADLFVEVWDVSRGIDIFVCASTVSKIGSRQGSKLWTPLIAPGGFACGRLELSVHLPTVKASGNGTKQRKKRDGEKEMVSPPKIKHLDGTSVPEFSFTPLKKKPNWAMIRAANIDRMIRQGDINALANHFTDVLTADVTAGGEEVGIVAEKGSMLADERYIKVHAGFHFYLHIASMLFVTCLALF
jgi:hypothetical protein